MIGKLRRKFILLNMLFVVSIFTVIFIVIALSYGHQSKFDNAVFMRNELTKVMMSPGEEEESQIDGPGRSATANDPSFREPRPDDDDDRGLFPLLFHDTADIGKRGAFLPYVIYRIGSDGSAELIQSRDLTLPEETAGTLVEAALSAKTDGNGSAHGYLSSHELRYLLKSQSDGTKYVIFADVSFSLAMFQKFMLLCAAVFAGACLLFFALSFFLSRWALAPTERAWEQQNRFVADASHELKTPITVILANLGIISTHPESTVREQAKWLRNTEEEAERMQQLIQDLLFLAKCDANAFQSVFSEIDVSDCAMDRILNFESVAFERDVTLDSDIAPGLKIFGNEGQMKQLIAILLDNAVKYAGAKGKVFLRAERKGERVVISVRNTGDPIDPAELPHIFERFYRPDKSRSRTEGGYGLGLSIAENIVKLHRGSIRCESTAETGTVFTAEFPAAGK